MQVETTDCTMWNGEGFRVRNRLIISIIILPKSKVEARNLFTRARQHWIGGADWFESAQLDFVHRISVAAEDSGERHTADGRQLVRVEAQLPISSFIPETITSFQASKLIWHDATTNWTQSAIIHRNLSQQASVQIDVPSVPVIPIQICDCCACLSQLIIL